MISCKNMKKQKGQKDNSLIYPLQQANGSLENENLRLRQ
jgi:hypothetical protein